MTERQLTEAFIRYPHRPLRRPGGIRAAVLCPLFFRERQPHMLFIKRSRKVSRHPGEVSFPGGIREAEDKTLEYTCLRETREEIGLPERLVRIVCPLDEVATTTGFHVSPFLGVIPHPYPFRPDGHEVAELIEIPLDAFLDPMRQYDFYQFNGRHMSTVIAYHLAGQIIWGATARIMERLLNLLRNFDLLPGFQSTGGTFAGTRAAGR
ncbi:MAG: CoA pyrophosphatase [Deltaproteobacteria bacterium]|nr:CoA pyrophosphatase [Candidatus Anaeroferrophillacea bacterium]